jgi:hypothetical protein
MNKIIYFSLLLVLIVASMNAMRIERQDDEDTQDREYLKREEAVNFYKRLFHFGTKNEEIKRETREVYEEKCESIVPTQR